MSERLNKLQNHTAKMLMDNDELFGQSVLDVGCGNKPWRRFFPTSKWTGVDIRPGMAEITANMCDLPCLDDSYDTVLATMSVQYADDPVRAFRELVRVAKSGGFIIVTVPSVWPEDGSIWRFTMPLIKGCVDAVTVDKERAIFVPLGGIGTPEGTEYLSQSKYGMGHGPDFKGWLQRLDKLYPLGYGIVMQKE